MRSRGMGLDEIFKEIKNKFSPRKFVDFEEEGFHFEIEPLTSMEEIILLESLQDIEGAAYIEALKRHTLAFSIKQINDTKIDNEVKYVNETGEEKIKSHFLFMRDYISRFPSPLIETLFDAYTNMVKILQQNIEKNAKFERIELSEEIVEETKEKFRKIKEQSSEGLTETERLNKKVEEEIKQADLLLAQTTDIKS
jgi:hypothetical protein